MSQISPANTADASLPDITHSLRKVYDGGLRSFRCQSPLQVLHSPFNLLDLPTLCNVEPLAQKHFTDWHRLDAHSKSLHIQSLRQMAVQSQDPLALYYSMLSEKNQTIILAILKNLSTSQFIHILDLHAWKNSELDLKHAMDWLMLYEQIEGQELAERFIQLEEEVQIGLLGKHIRGITTAEYEGLPPEVQDRLYPFPGQAYYYDILCEDSTLRDNIQTLISHLQHHHMEYTLSLLTHIAWTSPLEAEHLALQFRRARNEEDGFLDPITSYKQLQKLPPHLCQELEAQASAIFNLENTSLVPDASAASLVPSGTVVEQMAASTEGSFLLQLLQYAHTQVTWWQKHGRRLEKEWMHCTLALLSALDLEPYHHKELRTLWEHVLSSISLALHILSQGHPLCALHIWESTPSLSLLRYAKSHLMAIRLPVIQKLIHEGLLPSSARTFVVNENYGALIDIIDSTLTPLLEPEDMGHLKGLYNRFPLMLIINSTPHRHQRSSCSHTQGPAHSTAHTLIYTPIESGTGLCKVLIRMVVLLWDITMARLACGQHTPQHYRTAWIRGLASIAIGGQFIHRVFDKALCQKLLTQWSSPTCHSSATTAEQRFYRFCESLPTPWTDPELQQLQQILNTLHSPGNIPSNIEKELHSALQERAEHYWTITCDLIQSSHNDAAVLAEKLQSLTPAADHALSASPAPSENT